MSIDLTYDLTKQWQIIFQFEKGLIHFALSRYLHGWVSYCPLYAWELKE
jgi:hypothetical protein